MERKFINMRARLTKRNKKSTKAKKKWGGFWNKANDSNGAL